MGTIRVISGVLKGRIIPFDNWKFGNADITPQKVKGALFSILGETMVKKSFLDLYAGSGQIGIEAMSRGADPVILVERDVKRCEFIRQSIEKFGTCDNAVILNLPAEKALLHSSQKNIRADYIFIDPPYHKESESLALDVYCRILASIEGSNVLSDSGIIIVQHFSRFRLDEAVSGYIRFDSRMYGGTSLTFYRKNTMRMFV